MVNSISITSTKKLSKELLDQNDISDFTVQKVQFLSSHDAVNVGIANQISTLSLHHRGICCGEEQVLAITPPEPQLSRTFLLYVTLRRFCSARLKLGSTSALVLLTLLTLLIFISLCSDVALMKAKKSTNFQLGQCHMRRHLSLTGEVFKVSITPADRTA